MSDEDVMRTFDRLIEKGAHNLNLVTPTHYADSVMRILEKYHSPVPIVYNCGGYESVDTLKMLDGYIDIYLPDFKYADSVLAKKYSKAENYPIHAKRAIDEMVRQVGGCEFDENGMMKRGIIIRHLVLPSYTDNSKRVIEYLYNTYGDDIYMSIMNQYTPLESVLKYPEINRKVTESEYDEVLDFAVEIGVENAFVQEGGTVSESFIPLFDGEGVVKKVIPAGLIIELTEDYSGLMPRGEYSWFANVKFDQEVKEGDTITVKVMAIDDEKNRVSLSHRETLENTWSDIKLRRGDKITVTISSITDKGALVNYKNVQGFLPISEVTSLKRISKVDEVYPVNSTLEVMVQDCDPAFAKLRVSAKAIELAKERDTFDKYFAEQAKEVPTNTIGDMLENLDLEKKEK